MRKKSLEYKFKQFKTIIFILSIGFLLTQTSCFEEDERIEPILIPKELKIAKMEQSIYSYQAFFDLEKNEFVKINSIYDWDLGFESSTEGYHIILNSSRMMQVANMQTTDFEAVTEQPYATSELWTWDHEKGSIHQTGVGEWLNSSVTPAVSWGTVYIVDLGVNTEGLPLGFKKVVFENLENDTYHFRYANLDGSEEFSAEITKLPLVNFVYFSLMNNETIAIEPLQTEWDVQLSQSREKLAVGTTGDSLPYAVRGMYLNPFEVKAMRYSNVIFENFTVEALDTVVFSKNRNIIGHEWKYYDLEAGIYAVDDKVIAIIQDTEGYIFKLHFLSYYNTEGEKGFPVFEYKRL